MLRQPRGVVRRCRMGYYPNEAAEDSRMRLLIVSVVLLAASLFALAFLPAYVVRDVYLRGHLWVVHLHLNRTVFIVLLGASIVAFLFARFDLTVRVR
jgi:hypothetical protein